MKTRLVLLLAALAPSLLGAQTAPPVEPAAAPSHLADGDAQWERRAEGSEGAVAKKGPIDDAIASYKKELAVKPGDPEASWRLMRALYFKGEYTTSDVAEK